MHVQTLVFFSLISCGLLCLILQTLKHRLSLVPSTVLGNKSDSVAVSTDIRILCLIVHKCKCVFKEKLPLKVRLKAHIHPGQLRRI